MTYQLGVLVRRRFRAARADVFRAFAEPAMLRRWFSPSPDIVTEVIEHDFRAGGRYRFGFVYPDGQRETVLGEFCEIEPPVHLAFTWSWGPTALKDIPPDRHAGIETLVTIRFREIGDETEVVVTHDRFSSYETRDRHDAGWSTTLERLAALLAGQ